jgi:hypothetical protein
MRQDKITELKDQMQKINGQLAMAQVKGEPTAGLKGQLGKLMIEYKKYWVREWIKTHSI